MPGGRSGPLVRGGGGRKPAEWSCAPFSGGFRPPNPLIQGLTGPGTPSFC